MKNLIKTLTLVTTGLVVGVAVGRMSMNKNDSTAVNLDPKKVSGLSVRP